MTAPALRAAGAGPPGWTLVLAGAFLGLAWTLYAPALHGPPIADDFGYLLNPWVVELSPRHVLEILDPTSQATRSLNNYAPLRALLNSVEYRLFGQNSFPFHVVNVVLHALASLLLVALFRAVAIPWWAAAAAGALFLVHPANVEAVAWMTQVWTPLALALAVAAVLRRHALASGSALFALALLAKPTAAGAIALAALLDLQGRRPRSEPQASEVHPQGRRPRSEPQASEVHPQGRRPRSEPQASEVEKASLRWLPIWAVLLALYALAEFATFFVTESGAERPPHPDLAVRARSVVALLGRYAALAATSWGASAFADPPPAVSLLDPWWLLGLAVLALAGWRGLRALRRGSDEAAFLAWAALGFAPVSQLLPFLYPMGDRYLYFMLPGLFGAALCAAREAAARLDPRAQRIALRAGVAATAALGLAFALHSFERAKLWRSEDLVLADSARHYPDGVPALLLRARAAAAAGDVEAVLRDLERCRQKGWDFYTVLAGQPAYAPVRDDPRFVAFLHEMAGERIARSAQHRLPTQLDLRDLAEAHLLRGEPRQAIAVLERAIALSGPLDAELRARLAQVRAAEQREAGR